ncbi:hypothetical protein [Micromonospora sp. CPCC 206061]|uniref:hypothetical protein n=1 Tax=Micromonospora sp. CPCC 206061 TaxID=3122410 RepID=UPI002FF22D6C
MSRSIPVAAVSDAVVDGVDVDAVATAVRGCPGVLDLYGGPPQLIATYLPGRRVEGVRVDRWAVAVQVRARWGAAVSDLSAQIRAALRPLAGGRRIDIVWADVADPPPLSAAPATTSGARSAPERRGSWTRPNAYTGRVDDNSSEPTIPTGAATRPPSSSA